MAELTKADAAVAAVLRAIQADGRKAYLMGLGTETYRLLTEAYAERTARDAEAFRAEHWAACRPERVVRDDA